MSVYRTQVEFQPVSGLPEDVCVNTWHFEDSGDTGVVTAAAALNGVMASAYTRIDPDVGNSVAEMISSSISRANKPKVATYEIDPLTGLAISDRFEDTFAGFAAPIGAGPMPREIGLCLSMSANAGDWPEETADGVDAGAERDRPASRHRGRVYIGPLSQAALTAGTDSRPGNAVLQAILAMGEYLMSNPAPLVDNELVPVVYSRQSRVTHTVTGYWIDNEWDVQRRRGLRRTTRLTLGVI